MPRKRPAIGEIAANIGGAFQIMLAILLIPFSRRRIASWGASADEVRWALPGDDLIPNPRSRYTRAITIRAGAAQIWPWLVQMGQGRGGLYSFDLLENLAGCDIHSVDRIVPELQNLQPGDLIRLGPEGYPVYKVVGIEPGQALILWNGFDAAGKPVEKPEMLPAGATASTWVFVLDERQDGTTRLILRGMLTHPPTFASRLIWGLTDPIGFVMMRRQMRGIKERVERAGGQG